MKVSEAAVVTGLFLSLVFMPFPARAGDMDTPSERAEALIKELHEAPAVRYVSEEEIDAMGHDFRQADALLTARIESVVLADMGPGGVPVPMTRVFLDQITVQSGDAGAAPGAKASFLYRHSPDTISAYKGQRVIAVLNHSDAKSKTLFAARIVPADKTSLQLLVDAIQSKGKKGGADCAKNVEADVCEA
ncbi:MAG TPA: hypothetical protein VL688_07220 [Verrucomicrobiae bacterium]|jgi:hypothetical protein|nr:hypothetical protein [Verrucomicrobiae bacterium]